MEYGLGLALIFLTAQNYVVVLILVLMEYGLGPINHNTKKI